jgi:hypothetical protein
VEEPPSASSPEVHSSPMPALAVHSLAHLFPSALLNGKMTYHQLCSSKSTQPCVRRGLKTTITTTTTTNIHHVSQRTQLESKSTGNFWLKLPCRSMVSSTHGTAVGNGYFPKSMERRRAKNCNGPRDKAGEVDSMPC